MSKKRTVDKNLGMFMVPGGGFLVPTSNLNVGPGKPGPGDEWRMPDGTEEPEEEVDLERVHPHSPSVLPLRTRTRDSLD